MKLKDLKIKIAEEAKRAVSCAEAAIPFEKIFAVAVKIIPACVLFLLFLTPVSMRALNLYESETTVSLFYSYFLPFEDGIEGIRATIFYWPLFLIYFLPLNALFLVLSIFIKDDLRKCLYITTLFCFTVYIYCLVILLVNNANCARWFISLPWYLYALSATSILFHAGMSFYGLHYLRNSDPKFAEYKEIQAENKTTKVSVKTKIILAFVITIFVILVTFTAIILVAYKKMMTEAVSDVGKTQAEQTASVYDSAEGKYEKIANYFDAQKKTNSYAETPYERIDIIISSQNLNIYLETIDSSTKFPAFDVFAYTTGKPSKIPEAEKVISPEKAHEYIRMYQTGSYRKTPVYDKENKTCKYIYPVSLSRKAGQKLVGFSIVTYRYEMLMRQYFRTRVFVFTAILVFVYLSVLFSLFLADRIMNPLLFLRANVRKTSNMISDMLSGSAREATLSLEFKDNIKTRDEIKDLSTEIKDMVSLIKGIVPYISTSTLQHADKDTKRSTTSRDLCFLFTDIRGFTSLCEGMPPKKVVDILNHYLDIETEIILNNGGDIDKYAGDEMMAFFAGPKKEFNACKAAMEIRQAMKAQQEISMEDGSTFVSIGIGINSGKVVFGSVGSKTRKDFTSIGDTVNLAARLEGANKVYGSKAIITETVYSKLKNSFICRELDFITVKGKTKPVRIYEILQESAIASSKLQEIKVLFEKGLSFYRGQKWDEAQECFAECAQKYNDMPSVVFLDRINHFKGNPPAKDWDGVFKMEAK